MQTSKFGKSKGLWKSLSQSTWSELFDGLGISLLLTANPSIQVEESYIDWFNLLLHFDDNIMNLCQWLMYAVHCIWSIKAETSEGEDEKEKRQRHDISGSPLCIFCLRLGRHLKMHCHMHNLPCYKVNVDHAYACHELNTPCLTYQNCVLGVKWWFNHPILMKTSKTSPGQSPIKQCLGQCIQSGKTKGCSASSRAYRPRSWKLS